MKPLRASKFDYLAAFIFGSVIGLLIVAPKASAVSPPGISPVDSIHGNIFNGETVTSSTATNCFHDALQ
jgi:hypothetical protein